VAIHSRECEEGPWFLWQRPRILAIVSNLPQMVCRSEMYKMTLVATWSLATAGGERAGQWTCHTSVLFPIERVAYAIFCTCSVPVSGDCCSRHIQTLILRSRHFSTVDGWCCSQCVARICNGVAFPRSFSPSYLWPSGGNVRAPKLQL
jgi:hypothetical protein